MTPREALGQAFCQEHLGMRPLAWREMTIVELLSDLAEKAGDGPGAELRRWSRLIARAADRAEGK
jgi:hypothetical protein